MANDTKKGRASLVEIQTWWKVPTIAHFCSLFRAKFGLPDFEIEELEEALVSDTQDDPNDFLKNLLARILFGCYGRKDINSSNYDKYLRDIMKHRWEMEESRVNPLNSEDTTYHSLPTLSKVELLHALCDYRLDAEDVSDLLKGTVGEHMRIEPLGSDSDGAKYWYFYGTRLYKETKKLTKAEKEELRKKREKEKRKKRREKAKERAKEKEKLKKIKLAKKNAGEQAWEVDQNDSCTEENSQDTPTTSTTVSSESDSDDDLEPPRWHLVCDTQEDWELLAQKFKKTKSKNEKELYRALADDFLPVMVDLYNQKEKALRKKLLEMAPRRTSGRIQEKMQRRTEEDDYWEGYSDDEGNQEEDKFSCNERRQRNRQQQKELQILEEQEAKKRKEEEEEKAKKAKEDRAKRVQLREERARLIAEGKTIPQELMITAEALSESPKPKPKKPKFSGVRDDEFDSLYISMYKVLDAVKRHSNSWPFLEPVNEEYAPKYLEYVEKPMDIGTMEEKLDKKQYSSKSEFVDDMHLMFENCETYNGSESEYTEMARTLEVVFTKMMLRCFPEDDIDFFDEEFFMSEKCEPRKSSRTRKTVEELDKKVFGSFREDTSEESESEDDNYFPSEKKFKGKGKSPKKRPQRMPRVNYAMDGDESSRGDLSRAYALRNFYSNRGVFNADPTYGVTCSHMSVMRVVDGKIVEERGPLRPATQSASTKDVTQSEGEDDKKKKQTASQSSSTEGMETTKEDKNEQSVKKDPEVNEDHSSLKNNLSSFLKHPKVRSKTERLKKEAEKNSFVNTPVSLPSTVFTPTTVSKAVPAILSKGNRLKQEMKIIAADGTKQSKLNSKLKTSHSPFVSNGPENVQQIKTGQKNIHFDKIKADEVKSKQVTEDKAVKNVQLKTGNTEVPLSSSQSGNTKLLNPIHSIPSTSSISSESLPPATVTSLPLSTTKQANDFTDNNVHSLNSSHSGHQPETSRSELLIEKQEDKQAAVVQDRVSVITFQPNNAPQSEEAGGMAVKNTSNKPQEPGNDHFIEKSNQINSSNIAYSALQVNSQSSMADIYAAKPVMEPRQKVYVASKPEAQRSIVHEDSDLKDLIDMDTLQDKKSNFPTASINHILSPEVSRINSFNTSPLMMNRVLLPNSLTINHRGSADTSHNFAQLKGILQNPAPHHQQRSAQPMQHDPRFTPHLSGGIQHSDSIQQHTGDRLQHPDDRLQNSDARLQHPDTRLQQPDTRLQQPDARVQQPDARLQQPDARLQHPDSRLQQTEDRLQHPEDRLQPPDARLQHSDARLHQSDTRQQHSEDRTQHHEARLQHPEARLYHSNARLQNQESNRLQHQDARLHQGANKLQQHHEPKLQHQETRMQHPEAMLHHLEVSQLQRPEASRLHHPETSRLHHPEARMQHLDARLQHSEANRLHQTEVRHPEARLQHPLSSLHQTQDSIRQSTASMQPAGNRQLSSLQYSPAHLNWNQHQQLYQTQPIFQVGTQAPVGMSQAYQMSVPGHPSLQNGSFPPT